MQEHSKDNVKVSIRVRPLNEKEKSTPLSVSRSYTSAPFGALLDHGGKRCLSVPNAQSVLLDMKPEPKNFSFDFVGDESLTQKDIYNEAAKPIVEACLQGYNGTIFAYGQTGAGKTFTIQGPNVDQPNYENDELRGLMPRAFEHIFDFFDR